MITIDDVLDLEWPGPPEWSSCGTYLTASVRIDDESTLLVGRPDDGSPWHLKPNGGSVAEFSWSPTGTEFVCTTEAGETLLGDPTDRSLVELTRTPEGDTSLTWSPDGSRLAFYREGSPWWRSLPDGRERRLDVPEHGPFLPEERAFDWRSDGLLAYRFANAETKRLGVVDVEVDSVVWRTRTDASAQSPIWLGDGRLCFERQREYGSVREIVAAEVANGDETVLFTETDRDAGTLSRGAPRPSPDGQRIAVALPIDGYEHVHVIDVETGERTQLTHGPFEDKGLADSTPRWIDSETLVFASNRRDPGQRQLFTVSLDGAVSPLVETEGTNVTPRPSPDGTRIAYRYAGRGHSTELRTCELTDGDEAEGSPHDAGVTRFTRTNVESWSEPPIDPTHVSYESIDRTIEGYLLDPRRGPAVSDDATDLPAVVYVHGGPMRQMRDGFHPNRSYGLAYAFQQYLAPKGYVGLFVNYRGGIGYGREFRGAIGADRGRVEMTDVVRGAEYLRDLDYTSGTVGLWGLSYGGYAALQLPGTHPSVFDVTVNLAGLADFENYHEWATETKTPAVASRATTVMGSPHEAPDRWADASPITHMDRYETPLYSFHGTDDRYVNVEQQDLLINELLDHDVRFEAEYYPGESHVFSKRSVWYRTFERIENAFAEHL